MKFIGSYHRRLAVTVSLLFPMAWSFTATPLTSVRSYSAGRTFQQPRTRLFAEAEQKKKKGSLDESVRTKLVSESIAPWRTLRLFLYGALGSGAFIGGLINLTGTAAVFSGAKEGDLNTEVRKCIRSLLFE